MIRPQDAKEGSAYAQQQYEKYETAWKASTKAADNLRHENDAERQSLLDEQKLIQEIMRLVGRPLIHFPLPFLPARLLFSYSCFPSAFFSVAARLRFPFSLCSHASFPSFLFLSPLVRRLRHSLLAPRRTHAKGSASRCPL
jgi:hypothetical protein